MWIDVNVRLELKNIFIFSCNVFTFTIGVTFFLVTLFGNSNVFSPGLFLRKTIFGRTFFWKFRAEKILAETENRFEHILSQGCSATCFALRNSLHLTGVHFILGAFRQSFCFNPGRWCNAPIWNFPLRICCNGSLVATVFHY